MKVYRTEDYHMNRTNIVTKIIDYVGLGKYNFQVYFAFNFKAELNSQKFTK